MFFSPHGVDCEYFAPMSNVKKDPSTIVFTGNMNYAPNVDAAQFFYERIFPLVRSEVPDVKWQIIGADPAPVIEAMDADPAIAVTGRVPDLREYMNKATLAIAPLRIGAGLQNKVLEGMSMQLPMVITSVANEGIKAVDGKNILIADEPSAFAEQVVRLLRDAEAQNSWGMRLADSLSRNGHGKSISRIWSPCTAI